MIKINRATFKDRNESDRSGTSADVFYLDKNWIARLTYNHHDGFRFINELNERYGKSKFFPIIDLERSTPEESVFVVERLLRCDWDLWYYKCDDTGDLCELLNGYVFYTPEMKKHVHSEMERVLDDNHPLKEVFEFLLTITEQYYQDTGIFLKMDINPSNLMQRANGDLVWSDPYTTWITLDRP